jgi:hypothetical protein
MWTASVKGIGSVTWYPDSGDGVSFTTEDYFHFTNSKSTHHPEVLSDDKLLEIATNYRSKFDIPHLRFRDFKSKTVEQMIKVNPSYHQKYFANWGGAPLGYPCFNANNHFSVSLNPYDGKLLSVSLSVHEFSFPKEIMSVSDTLRTC